MKTRINRRQTNTATIVTAKMGLGYEFPPKRNNDRSESYGAWVTKYNNAQKQTWNSSGRDKHSKDGGKNTDNPWGPTFKNKQNFLDMHFC